jgi:hypothetical protein
VLAWKFLRAGAVAPFSGVTWPAPGGGGSGAWLEASGGPLIPCACGVHACRTRDLALWINAELWRCELRDPVQVDTTKVVASAGRLLAREPAWTAEAGLDFAAGCAARVHELAAGGHDVAVGYARDIEGLVAAGDGIVAAATGQLIAREAALVTGGTESLAREDAMQAAWFSARLGDG